jgi:hypothetical protein
VGGIYNGYATSSYVDDIAITGVGAVSTSGPVVSGLVIDAGVTDSGPYSNILFNASLTCNSNSDMLTCPQTACVRINTQTRGIHGITCIGHSATGQLSYIPPAAIYLDGSNNTIEDVHAEGFYDAVVVGDEVNGVSGNTLININGAAGNGPTYNSVHICAGNTVQHTACSNNGGAVGDLGLFGIRIVPKNYVATPVRDDLNGVNVNSATPTANVAMYILGEQVGSSSGQYSRFTTANVGQTQGNNTVLSVPSWGVGIVSPPSGACSAGSLYSNTTGQMHNTTVYVCTYGSNGSTAWTPIA